MAAFTTIPGAAGSDTTYSGSDGIDVITLRGEQNFFLGAQPGNDAIAFSTAPESSPVIGQGNLRGGLGNDSFVYSGTTPNIVGTTINGNQGLDLLGAAGQGLLLSNSNAYGGKGVDTINIAQSSSSLVNGNIGSDVINILGQQTSNSIYGGKDGDTITIGDNSLVNTLISGDLGNDTITAAITAAGGTVFTNSSLKGGDGNDSINATGSDVGIYIEGNDGGDSLTGGTGGDTLLASTGNDSINGAAGADLLSAGEGNDQVTGGNGTDTINVTAGTDTITDLGANSDVDHLVVFALATANSTVVADVTLDSNSGNQGVASFTVNNDVDFNISAMNSTAGYNGVTITAAGNAAGSVLTSSQNGDNVTGGDGQDNITGGNSVDTITGSAAADSINAGAANDSIILAASGDTGTVDASTAANPAVFNVAASDIQDVDQITVAAGDIITIGAGAITWTANNDSEVAINAGGGAVTPGDSADISQQTVAWDAANNTATTAAKAASNAILLTWDTNGNGAGTTYNSVLLLGVTDLTTVGLTGTITV